MMPQYVDRCFSFGATLGDSAVLVVDADLDDIEYAKGKTLLDRFPALERARTQFERGSGEVQCKIRDVPNPLADRDIANRLKEFGAKRLILLGDDHYGGVSAAALSALELGYDVYVVDDATTFWGKASRKNFRERLSMHGGLMISARSLAMELEQSSEPGS